MGVSQKLLRLIGATAMGLFATATLASPASQQPDTAAFNQLLQEQLEPGVLSTTALPEHRFLLSNPVQALQATVTPDGVVFHSTSPEANEGGNFSLHFAGWGREGRWQATRPASPYQAGDQVLRAHLSASGEQGVAEQFSNTPHGIRQDFILPTRPQGDGELQLQVQVSGATLQAKGDGFDVALNDSQRVLTYNRLLVTDAMGASVPARMELAAADQIRIVVDDRAATYPLTVDPTVGDVNWISMGGLLGANGSIYAIARNGTDIYVAGTFTKIGDINARIAKWDGSNWTAIASTVYTGAGTAAGTIYAMAWQSSASRLVVAGDFTKINGTSYNRIARWTTAWGGIGAGCNNTLKSLAVDGANIYVGGINALSACSGVSVAKIAKWTGSAWSALGSGVGPSVTATEVKALATDGSGNLYAGGTFTTAGGLATTGLAKWNGSAWTAINGLDTSYVTHLTTIGSSVYVAGAFQDVCPSSTTACTFGTDSLGTASAFLAKLTGTSWSTLGTVGIDSNVSAMTTDGSNLFVSGGFTSADGVANTNLLAKWNGSAWSSVTSSAQVGANVMTVDGSGNLVAAGIIGATALVRQNGSNWNLLVNNPGLENTVNAVVADGSGNVYVGGTFASVAGVPNTANIAKWNGTSWSALGTGMAGASAGVLALAVDGSGNLYAGGDFTSAGGVAKTGKIAKWNGSSWSALGATAMTGTSVDALQFKSGILYVGGNFTAAGGVANTKYIAKWNGASWSALGTGLNAGVRAIAVTNSGTVYVGGDMTLAGGVTVANIAQFSGGAWSSLATGMDNTVWALAYNESTSTLYAGGEFSMADATGTPPANTANLAQWNGSAWSAVGGTGVNGGVFSLLLDGSNRLYVGGVFTTANGSSANGAALLSGGSWSTLGTGVNSAGGDKIVAMAFDSAGDLYVGGNFTTVGGKVSAYLAKWAVVDTDNDGTGNLVDSDDDNDTLTDAQEAILGTNPLLADTDGDSVNDNLDVFPLNPAESADTDGDGVGNNGDNCPSISNADQLNTDGVADGGNACDSDDDNDGMPDSWETTYGLNPLVDDAAGDVDSDGFSNLQEYTNGTNPTAFNASSAKNNFDSDTDADIFWRDSSTGTSVVWLMQNGVKTGASVLGTNASSFTVEAVADFDADGDVDVLFRDNTSGQSLIWVIQNGVKVAANVLGTNAASYAVRGVGDFDGDGDADILFRDNTSGSNLVWSIQNAIKDKGVVIGTNDDIAYTVAKVADFDGDGDDDILYRRDDNGGNVVWVMQNGIRLAKNFLGYNAATNSVGGAADFDADGDADILFRDSATGSSVIWRMQGAAKVGSVVLGSNASTFSVAALADFDRDGDADVLYRDSASGSNVIWTIQNAAKTGATVLGSNATAYSVAGTADFDADGDADILFRNNSTGANVVWIIENAARTAVNVLTSNSATSQTRFEQ